MSDKDKNTGDEKEKKGLFGKAIDALTSRDEKEALEQALKERDETKKAADQAIAKEKLASAQAKAAAQKELQEAEKRAADAETRLKAMEAELAKKKQQEAVRERQVSGDFGKEAFTRQMAKPLAEHTVAAGETLSHLALKYYGHSTRDYFMVIYEANKATIGDDPGMIRPGMVLKVPELPADLKGK